MVHATMHPRHDSVRPRHGSAERGIALLLVVTILVTMVLVALPFAVSMRQGEERTQALGAQQRADDESRLLAEHMALWLQRTLPSEEQARQDAGETSIDADPTVDSLEEITPDERFRAKVADMVLKGWLGDRELAMRAAGLKARGLDPITDDRGSIWTAEVQDAQARIHVEGASPFLLGNLFGGALLAEELDAGATDIAVEHVASGHAGLPGGFDPRGGFIRVGGEVIRYTSFDGTVFRGCERGALRQTPLKDNREATTHDQGTPVVDYVAYKLATHVIARHPGRLTSFRTLEELRDIASWGEGGVLMADRLERLLPYLTVWARRESSSGWLASQLVVNALPDEGGAEGPEVVQLRDRANPTGTTRYLAPGVIVRISDGVRTAYQTVALVGDEEGRQEENQVMLAGRVNAADEEIAFEGGRTTLSAWAPHPININTASREVLFAVMANVHLRGAKEPDKIITPEIALRLAEQIVAERRGDVRLDPETGNRMGGPFRHAEDFGRWIGELVERDELTRDQRAALYLNAINPHSASLGLGTAPWCFRTLDVYHVETRVTVNDRSGQQVAEAGRREVIQVGPGGPATWSVDSQTEFEERLAMGSGAKWVTSFPYNVVWRDRNTAFVQPGLRGPQGWMREVYPDDRRGEELGDMRLEPFRMQLPGAQVVEHFDDAWYTEGWFTGYQGSWDTKTVGAIRRSGDSRPQPFTLSFWWRPYSGANWTAFDVGMERFENRVALFVTDGQQGQELVFRVCGSTLEPRGAEIYVPLDRLGYQPGDWYHIEVCCRGEDPSTMRLLVDGVDLGIRRAMTYLTADLAEDTTDVAVELLEQFPVRGCIRIGTELIEYDDLGVDALRTCRRGTRGTQPRSHPAGTPVELMGYALPLTVDLLRGGRTLSTELKKWSAVRIVGGEDTASFTTSDGTPVTLTGYNPENSQPTLTAVPMWDQDLDTALGAFQDEGLALLGCWLPGGGGNGTGGGGTGAPAAGAPKLGGWEVVHYTRQSSSFSVTRYQQTAWQGAAEPYFLITRVDTYNMDYPCFLVPISVHAAGGGGTAGEDYLNPENTPDRDILGRYYEGEEHNAFVLLGTDTPDGQHEVIAYNSIDRERASQGVYFVRDRQIGNLTGHFFGQTYTIPGSGSGGDPTPDPGPDPQPDPDPNDGTGPVPPGGIPPGQREPSDEAPGSGEGDTPDGGSSGLPTEPGVGDGSDDTEPADDTEGEAGDERGGLETGSESAREDGGGTTTTPPDPDEPPIDSSGAGDDEGAADDVDPVPPTDEAPGAWEEEDPPVDTADTSDVPWTMPTGPETARQLAAFRGVLNTFDRDHSGSTGDRNDRFLPCFRVFEGVQLAPYGRAGAFDRVTFHDGTEGGENRFEAAVRWGHEYSGWCALEDFTDRVVRASETGANVRRSDTRGYARMLKFPCGEMPEMLPDTIEFARSSISNSGVVTAFLDEVHLWRHPLQEKLVLVNEDGVAADARSILLKPTVSTYLSRSEIDGASSPCGAVILDGEIIIYRGISEEDDGIVLEDCARGQLGSRAAPHAVGSGAWFLPDVFVSYLEGGLEIESSTITIANLKTWPREGLVRILSGEDGELVHYTRRTEESLLMPESLDVDEADRGRGLFRGRFGTTATQHDSQAIVVFQPFRYWDRYTPRTVEEKGFEGVFVHPESSYLELGTARQDAWWHGFTWKENLTGAPVSETSERRSEGEALELLDIVVMARFNPNVAWDTKQILDLRSDDPFSRDQVDPGEAAKSSLFLFDDPGDFHYAQNRVGNALGLEAPVAEFRVYFAYKLGAWYGNDERESGQRMQDDDRVLPAWWKRTPWFQSLESTVSYRTRVLYSTPLGNR
ncbi:MAG: hypothetical protein AB7T63_12560 [Planctomycetota bacterium]